MKLSKKQQDQIKDEHKAACPEWQKKMEDILPKLFPKKPQLKVGKWYHNKRGDYLMVWNGGDRTYGFFRGEFGRNWSFVYQEVGELATDDEVLTMLTKEAKKRGLIGGAEIKSVFSGDRYTLSDNYHYRMSFGNLFADSTDILNPVLMNEKGEWSTVIEEPKPKLRTGWYKDTHLGYPFIGYYKDNKRQYYISGATGFCTSYTNRPLSSRDILATDGEVEEALTKEAKKRGYNIDSVVDCSIFVIDGDDFWVIDPPHIKISSMGVKYGNLFSFQEGELRCNGWTIFRDGKWAPIIEQTETITYEGTKEQIENLKNVMMSVPSINLPKEVK